MERNINKLIQIDDDLVAFAQKRALEELESGCGYGKSIINSDVNKEGNYENQKDEKKRSGSNLFR